MRWVEFWPHQMRPPTYVGGRYRACTSQRAVQWGGTIQALLLTHPYLLENGAEGEQEEHVLIQLHVAWRSHSSKHLGCSDLDMGDRPDPLMAVGFEVATTAAVCIFFSHPYGRPPGIRPLPGPS